MVDSTNNLENKESKTKTIKQETGKRKLHLPAVTPEFVEIFINEDRGVRCTAGSLDQPPEVDTLHVVFEFSLSAQGADRALFYPINY